MLIAQLSEAGVEGFEEEDNALHAFAEENILNEENISAIISSQQFSFSKKIIGQKNWNEEWEKNFHPVVIDDFCMIRAAFHEAVVSVKYDIIITPKMSFGTGHHATTYMMVEAMRQINFNNKKVLDFGTGTGVLAILAEKCGASEVLAIDCDEWSITHAHENISVNQCRNITVKKSDSTQGTSVFDIILANITKNIIVQNLPSFWQHLTLAGVLIISGLLETDSLGFQTEAEKNDFEITGSFKKQGWVCIGMKKHIKS